MSDVKLLVHGEEVPMNEFVQKIMHDVLKAVLNNLRDVDLDEISRIEIY